MSAREIVGYRVRGVNSTGSYVSAFLFSDGYLPHVAHSLAYHDASRLIADKCQGVRVLRIVRSVPGDSVAAMTHPFSSQDERDAFRESLPVSDMFVVPASEVRMLLDALDVAERRASEAEGDTALLKRWAEAVMVVERGETQGAGQALVAAESAVHARARALALASVATGD